MFGMSVESRRAKHLLDQSLDNISNQKNKRVFMRNLRSTVLRDVGALYRALVIGCVSVL